MIPSLTIQKPSLLNYVPYVLSCLTCFRTARASCPLGSHVPQALHAVVHHVARALRTVVPQVPRTLISLMTHVPCALRALAPDVLCVPRGLAVMVNVPHALFALLFTTMICNLY